MVGELSSLQWRYLPVLVAGRVTTCETVTASQGPAKPTPAEHSLSALLHSATL